MKGIILAGGSGSRLSPLTKVVSKQLMPVYDKPMVYYPISTMMLAGIKDILIITTPSDQSQFKALLGDGSRWGVRFDYCMQPKPEGIAQAFILAEEFLAGDSCCLLLGDNLFYGHGLAQLLQEASDLNVGAKVFGYHVQDPERYGVVAFDRQGSVTSIEEKPAKPKSQYAVTGMYFYDQTVCAKAKSLKPSDRGELEITDLNRLYLDEQSLKVELLGRGFTWLDTGTHESLLEAGEFIHILQKRQNVLVGSPEEVAWRMRFIDDRAFATAIEGLTKSTYGKRLATLLTSPT